LSDPYLGFGEKTEYVILEKVILRRLGVVIFDVGIDLVSVCVYDAIHDTFCTRFVKDSSDNGCERKELLARLVNRCRGNLVVLIISEDVVNRYRLMDEEECEEFTDVYWIKFSSISNAR